MSMHEELKEKIRQAIGEASMCWEKLDSTGVFDSDNASRIAADLYDYVVEYLTGFTGGEVA
jgi:hypothetical protein